jgi:beta-aspartyl-peptidase (threonine type)
VIHGGAGKAPKDEPARAEAERALEAALAAGWAILNGGGMALDAVEVAVASMEASGCFNAGRGAVADRDGRVTLDAAIMDGTTRATGAVAAVEKLARAIPAARLVMDRTAHVLLVGASADAFALAGGVPPAAPGYFRAARAAEAGTVGAVALDGAGRLAAATATGGLAGKLPGRVGDSALVGAGTWADGRCAVSATGSGETFIRAAFAAQIAHGLATGGRSLVEATGTALADVVGLGGHGGCIAVDVDGNAVMPFTTEVMYRGIVTPGELPRRCTFPDEIIKK